MVCDQSSEIIRAARQLLSGRWQGVLSTQSLEYPGYPFGSAIPYGLGRDGWPLILVSHLARHTKNLDAAPECCLTITATGRGDIQKKARLTTLARAEAVTKMEQGQLERHFRYFPETREYHEQLSFNFYRLLPERFYYIGGFGAARWIGVDRMQLINPFSYADEEEALKRLNHSISQDTEAFWGRLPGGAPVSEALPVLAVGLDPHGLDLRQQEHLFRLPFSTPISKTAEAQRVLTQETT